MLDRDPLRFWYIVAATICLAIVTISIRGRLGYYINPRYFAFTTIASAVGFLVLVVGAFSYKYKGKKTVVKYESLTDLIIKMAKWLTSKQIWFLLIIAGLLFWSPPRSLMSSAANRRDQRSDSVKESDRQYIIESQWFSNPKTIYQLSQVLSIEEGQKEVAGKSFKLNGFVRADQKADKDIFRLSKFMITCCAVDATPNNIDVYSPNWQSKFKIDTWVEVDGKIEVLQTNTGQRMLLKGTIKEIQQPDEPYDYLYF